MFHRSFRYRLRPTPEQETALFRAVSVCRLIYNLALEQRRDHWRQYLRQTGRHICYPSQAKELTELRRQFDWIASVSQTSQQQALRDLDQAYQRFFRGVSDYPTHRKKGVNDSFRATGREVEVRRHNDKWASAWLPKIGWVKFRWTREISGSVLNVTVSHNADGWHISFAGTREGTSPQSLPAIGIDRGVANTLTLSSGEMMSLPESLKAIDAKKRRAQRIMTRRKRGSARYARARRRVASLSRRAARVRQDWLHRATTRICRDHGTVAIEALQTANMTKSGGGAAKTGLNRSILAQAWRTFENMLAYKLEERGGALVKVNPAYTSQTCSDCGTVDRESRESQASFNCRHCGFRAHADHNAAINILRRSTSPMVVEEGHWLSVEAITRGGDAPENQRAAA